MHVAWVGRGRWISILAALAMLGSWFLPWGHRGTDAAGVAWAAGAALVFAFFALVASLGGAHDRTAPVVQALLFVFAGWLLLGVMLELLEITRGEPGIGAFVALGGAIVGVVGAGLRAAAASPRAEPAAEA